MAGLLTVAVAVIGMLLTAIGLIVIVSRFRKDQEHTRVVLHLTHEAFDRLTHAVANPEQAWYWTPEWQAGEIEADSAIAAGELVGPMSEQDFYHWLDQLDTAADAEAKARA